MLSAGDLAIVNELLVGLKGKLKIFKGGLESKGLGANVKKKEIIINCEKPRKIGKKGGSPCAVSMQFCKCWVNKRCSSIRGRLK